MTEIAAALSLSKICSLPSCGKEFYRPRGLSDVRWIKREYCDITCSNRSRQQGRPTSTASPTKDEDFALDEYGNRISKTCPPPCSERFYRPKGIGAARWEAKTYHDPTCYAKRDRVAPNPVPSRDRKPKQAPPSPAVASPSGPWRPSGWPAQPYWLTQESVS